MSPCCPQGVVLDVTILSPRSGVGVTVFPQGTALDVTILSPRNDTECHHIVPKEWRWMSPYCPQGAVLDVLKEWH